MLFDDEKSNMKLLKEKFFTINTKRQYNKTNMKYGNITT